MNDSPTASIARLDASLARRGQPVVLRRYAGVPRTATNRNLTGHVRTINSDPMIGDIVETMHDVILSPTGIGNMWPVLDTDKIMISGKECDVKVVKPLFMAGTLVRCDLVVAG